jgi:hypothetical protein
MDCKFWKDLKNKKSISYFLLAMAQEPGRGPAGQASPSPHTQLSMAQPPTHSTQLAYHCKLVGLPGADPHHWPDRTRQAWIQPNRS